MASLAPAHSASDSSGACFSAAASDPRPSEPRTTLGYLWDKPSEITRPPFLRETMEKKMADYLRGVPESEVDGRIGFLMVYGNGCSIGFTDPVNRASGASEGPLFETPFIWETFGLQLPRKERRPYLPREEAGFNDRFQSAYENYRQEIAERCRARFTFRGIPTVTKLVTFGEPKFIGNIVRDDDLLGPLRPLVT